MESYPVDIDIDPEQIVRWLMVERQRGASRLDIGAWRLNQGRPIEPRMEDGFGDEEREDLNDEVTVAQLVITPSHTGEGWRIVVSVEVELEPIVRGEDSAEEEREPIDLDTFYLDFIRSGRGTASVAAEAESTEAEAHLDRLVHTIETNIHVPDDLLSKAGRVL
ncbi:MAG: hypothetical protein Q8M19_23060 [Reyranella sp.]|nr:hypothetical protein [Reyranella sp.]